MTSEHDDRLVNIEQMLARVDVRLESLCDRLDSQAEDVESTRRAIYGYNGTSGLLTQVELLKDAQARAMWLGRAIAGAAVAALVSAVAALLLK